MAWFKVDDGFYTSSKVLSIPRRHRLAAVGLWTMAGNWSARELADGKVPAYVLEELGATETLIQALVDARLWIDRRSTDARPDADQTSPHIEYKNWADYQPTRAEVEAERAKTAERQRRWRERQKSETGESPVSNGVTNPVTNGVSNGAPSRPVPTRPEKKEEAPARKRATSLPSDWVPTPEHIERAAHDGVDLSREVDKFKLHVEDKGLTSKSWNARFTRWLMQAAEYRQQRGGGTRPGAQRPGEALWDLPPTGTDR